MVTPFDQDGAVDIDSAVSLASFLQDQGNDALVLAGTTGEGPVLSDEEKVSLFEAISSSVNIPVIANTGSNDTAHSIKLTKLAEQVGVAGILAVTPYYNRPSQQGISLHLKAIADATSLPVLIYDIPIRTGRKVHNETMIKLSKTVSNIVGVKDASGDISGCAKLLANTADSFEVYSGDDSLTLAFVALGACGVIGVSTHWAASQFKEMIDSVFKGDLQKARNLNNILLESYSFETSEAFPNPIPTKAMMRAMGYTVGQCRLPLGNSSEEIDKSAQIVLNNLLQKNN